MNDGRGITQKTAAARLALLALSAAAAVQMSACAPRADDINKVQPGYLRKAIFQTGDEWYYRRTVAKSETTNSIIVEGSGDGYLTRVKFEVQEDYLLARKAYEGIPGSTMAEEQGSDLYEGTVVAAWPIQSHFDIQRGYDPATGNETNVISENTTDRPWTEREYIRVNWANNLVQDNPFAGNPAWDLLPISWVSTQSNWSDLQTSPTDIYASRFSADYIEVGEHVMLGMDLLSCASWVGFAYFGYTRCGFGEAQLRHAFLRVKEASDYVPRDYPDSVVVTDDDGNSTVDPETGEVVRENIFNRFGYFRVELPVYDRRYGYLESERLYRATLQNLWEHHTDENGQLIAYANRTPKPIVYYLNTEYPARWRDIATGTVAAEYNKAFSELTADLMGVSTTDIPDMFQVKVNDCNEENIIAFVNENPELRWAVKRGVCAEEPGGEESCDTAVDTDAALAEAIGVGNLKKVCTSLEAATLNTETGESAFTWQRIGDPRYKMIVWFNNPQDSGWGGLGMMHADARTGEIISSTAYLRPHYYQNGAARVVDYVAFMLGEIDVPEVIYGQTIRKQAAVTADRLKTMTQELPGEAFLAKLDQRMDAAGLSAEERLKVHSGDQQMSRLAKLDDTKFANKATRNDDIYLAAFDLGGWKPGETLPKDAMKRASPYGRAMYGDPTAAKRARLSATLGASGMCFLAHDFDNNWAGFAEVLKNKDADERYEYIFRRLFTHVMLHELGHNMGLRHNYEGTYDAMNYNDEFWQLHCIEGLDATDCDTDALVEERQNAGYDQWKNTTVMEYISSKGAFTSYLGKYDIAALRFGYASQVEVFTNSAEQADDGEALRSWRYLNDYKSIPNHLCGDTDCANGTLARAVIRDRAWVNFDPQNPPDNEVPYLFCSDEYQGLTPFCRAFDFGASVSEIFANYYSGWRDYYYFNNYVRDRLDPMAWSPWSATIPAQYAMAYTQQVAHYYYMLDTLQDGFRGSALRTDMAAALGNGLNFLSEVVSMPEPGRMCKYLGSDAADNWYWDFSYCDSGVAIDSAAADQAGLFEIPIGEGRPVAIDFTADYDDYAVAFIGSYYDKSNALFWAGRARPTLLRFNYMLDVRDYHVGLYTLFGPEIRGLYRMVVNQNSDGDDGNYDRLGDSARVLGSYWCPPANTALAVGLGHLEPRRLIDTTTGASLPGASCANPLPVYPRILNNLSWSAIVYAHALLSDNLDRSYDMSKNLKIYALGGEDAYPDWATLPQCTDANTDLMCYCEYSDMITGIQYRGVRMAGETSSLGCEMIAQTQRAFADYDVDRDPSYKDAWRAWVERLADARDLYIFFEGL